MANKLYNMTPKEIVAEHGVGGVGGIDDNALGVFALVLFPLSIFASVVDE